MAAVQGLVTIITFAEAYAIPQGCKNQMILVLEQLVFTDGFIGGERATKAIALRHRYLQTSIEREIIFTAILYCTPSRLPTQECFQPNPGRTEPS